jgi:hypothetical protein
MLGFSGLRQVVNALADVAQPLLEVKIDFLSKGTLNTVWTLLSASQGKHYKTN